MRCKEGNFEVVQYELIRFLFSFVYEWLCFYSQSNRHRVSKRREEKSKEEYTRMNINVNDLFSGSESGIRSAYSNFDLCLLHVLK